jgi:hypothetical protein
MHDPSATAGWGPVDRTGDRGSGEAQRPGVGRPWVRWRAGRWQRLSSPLLCRPAIGCHVLSVLAPYPSERYSLSENGLDSGSATWERGEEIVLGRAGWACLGALGRTAGRDGLCMPLRQWQCAGAMFECVGPHANLLAGNLPDHPAVDCADPAPDTAATRYAELHSGASPQSDDRAVRMETSRPMSADSSPLPGGERDQRHVSHGSSDPTLSNYCINGRTSAILR